MANMLKLLKGNKTSKLLSQINTSTIQIAQTEQKKIQVLKKAPTNINQLNPLDYGTEIKKPEPSSYRSSKDNKFPYHSKKNSEIPYKRDIDAILLNTKGSSLKVPQEEKKCQSLKKHHNHNKNNSKGKLVRSNSLFCNHENTNIMHNNSNYCHNNTSGIINGNYSNIGFNQSMINNSNDCANNKQYIIELEQTITILTKYISVINKELNKSHNKSLKKKDEQIRKLKVRSCYYLFNDIKGENEYLIASNKQLKTKLLEVLYAVKVYDLNELNRKSNTELLLSQLYNENHYLRKANSSILVIDNCSGTDNDQSIKGKMNESLFSKPKHKRQKTHINLNNIKAEEDNKKTINVTLFENNTDTSSREKEKEKESHCEKSNDEDALSGAISDLGNMIKTMKRRSDSSQKILIYKEEDNSSSLLESAGNNTNTSNVIQPLYYNKPSGNKERKMLEFTK